MYSFYVTVHARPPDVSAGPPIGRACRAVRPLHVERALLSATPMGTSFEAARQRLAQLERMYTEADGSFVWVSSQGEPAWQIDGNLYDVGDRLLFVDLK